jgi:molybdopterin/thiamine biosynthesis adenylyltransferase
MSAPRITLLGSHHHALVEHLEGHPEAHEQAAIVLFKRIHAHVRGLPDSDRFISREVHLLGQGCVTSTSGMHVSFNLQALREYFRRCEDESLVIGFVHNHPGGPLEFSEVDEENERTLLTAISNRNGPDSSLVALLWSQGRWIARVRNGRAQEVSTLARHVAVISDGIQIFERGEASAEITEVQLRQAAAFGKPFAQKMQSLRIGVVGNGGTGSPGATLAVRSGIGEVILFDKDLLQRSNLNRVRGLTAKDVGYPKANRLKEFIDNIGVPTKVAAIESYIDDSPEAIDAIATCDVILGCTDDMLGRDAINLCVYYYAQALIDVGLGGGIGTNDRGEPILRNHAARVSTILPEKGACLFCQGVITPLWIRTAQALRENPNMTPEEMKDRYLENGGTDAPGVGPFTSAAADFAIATLFDLIRKYRRFPPEVRQDLFFIDFVKMEISSPDKPKDPDCLYCGTRDFLRARETNRLGRPSLGARNEFV